MTASEFRSAPARVAEMREILNNPTLALALAVLKDEPLVDAPLGSEAIASVRLLSMGAQRDQVINTLLEMSEPLPPPAPEESATFGVNLTEFAPPQ